MMIDSLNISLGSNSSHQMKLITNDSFVYRAQETIGIFSDGANIDISPTLLTGGQDHFIGIILLVLMLFIAAIWYFLPDLIRNNFKSLTNNPFKRNWESTGNTSGLIVNSLLYLNFLIVFPLLIHKVTNSIFPDFLGLKIDWGSFYIIVLVLIIFILFRYFYIKLSGFIFQTFDMAIQQNRLYNSLDKGLGLISLPLLLFSIYSDSKFYLFLSVIVFVLFLVSRWIFTMVIGIRISKFSWFHIILYLCTLEIIPIILLLKMLENGVLTIA